MKQQDYKELAERMEEDAFHRGCNLSILVEDVYDIRFWESLIESVKPELKDKIDFPNPTSKGTRGTGILKKYKDFVKANFIICVDSDSEYLYNTDTWYSIEYIYNTIVYSKENFQNNHLTLNEICKDLTTKKYDFETLHENISIRIAPLFYIWLYFKEINETQFNTIINKEAFKSALDFKSIEFNKIGDETLVYQSIEDDVSNTLKTLENVMDESWFTATIEIDIPKIKKRLIDNFSIYEQDVLSFCYGHGVLEQFTEPFMIKIIDIMKDLKIEEIKRDLGEASNKDVVNTIRRIKNIAKQDISTKLNDSFKYIIYGTTQNKQILKIKSKLITELK